MSQSYEHIRVDARPDGVTLVTLDRPAAANAFNTLAMRELEAAFAAFSAETSSVRCVVLTGSGTRAFCAGADLKERETMTDETWFLQHAIVERMARTVRETPIPVIAAVNGAAYGGGCELVLLCDFAYASSTARFALPEVTRGIIPGAGGTQTMSRAIGSRRAKELMFTGRPFSAQEALEWGIVNAVYEPGELMERVIATAVAIGENAPIAVRQVKKSVDFGLQMDERTGMFFEIEAYNKTVPTADRREGVAAFNEKRKPQFQNR